MVWTTQNELGWSVTAVLTVKGPNEGPVTFRAELSNTTKDNALRVQDEGLATLQAINNG